MQDFPMVLAALLFWLAGIAWYFYNLRRGIYRLHPVWTYLLMAVGLGLAVSGVVLSPDVWRWTALGVLFLLTGVFFYWMWVYSVTPGTLGVRAGEPMPGFEALDSTGERFRPQDLAGRRAALYVFYRGYW